MHRLKRTVLMMATLWAGGCDDDTSGGDTGSGSESSTGMSESVTTSGGVETTDSTSTTSDVTTGGTSSAESSSSGGSDSASTTGMRVETTIEVERIGRYAPDPLSDIFDEGAAEIAAYDATTQALFVTNGMTGAIDVIDISDPTSPVLLQSLTTDAPDLAGPTSVSVFDGVVAAAFPASDGLSNGSVVFFDSDGTELAEVVVGVLPDMVTFAPDGATVLVANEGEPTGYDVADIDPEGSVSLIDVSGGVMGLRATDVTTVGFGALTEDDLDGSTRIFGPGASIAQDLEPEYVTVSPDGTTAWVSLQENNALAIIDIATASLSGVVGMGFQDHTVVGLDPSDRDDAIDIRTGPVYGLRQADAIAAFAVDGTNYVVTANEGDARDYDGLDEEIRIDDLDLDPTAFPGAADFQSDEAFGRLNVTTELGDIDADGDYDALYAFGSRSISIFDGTGTLVWDSGDQIEQVTAMALPDDFNSDNDENDSFESRSDNKGPEPEGLAVGEAFGTPYVFVGLERVGGLMTWDVSNPRDPHFHSYVNVRDFDGDPEVGTADDLAPEGVLFIAAPDSPIDNPLVVVTNEVSGTVSIYEISEVPVE